MRQAVFLIGGAGARLGALTHATPKPLLPVAGRPFLEHLLAKAARHGLRRVLLLAGHRAEVVHDYLAQSAIAQRLGLEIEVCVENEPLGTGGALVAVRDRLDPVFLLANGDTWFDFDWSRLIAAQGWAAVLALRHMALADRYETVLLDGPKIIGFRPRDLLMQAALINGGVYRMEAAALDDAGGRASLEQDILPALSAKGKLGGLIFDGPFIDIGIPLTYAEAQDMFARDLK